jgi:hypothetical protein
VAALGANLLLAHRPLYQALLAGQLLLYLTALAGYVLRGQGARRPCLTVPYYFIAMNCALLVGFLRYLAGAQSAAWERAGR